MGKNFSRNNASGKRRVADDYPTPYALTWEFLKADRPNWDTKGYILEPAAGDGVMVQTLMTFGFENLQSYDLQKDGMDFFNEIGKFQYLITNPPYSIANDFILKAKEVVTDQFAMLLPLTYLQGSRRLREIWNDREFPLARIYVFNRFPMFDGTIRLDWKIATGMQTMAWYV